MGGEKKEILVFTVRRGNIVAMAVGIIIGAAVGTIIGHWLRML